MVKICFDMPSLHSGTYTQIMILKNFLLRFAKSRIGKNKLLGSIQAFQVRKVKSCGSSIGATDFSKCGVPALWLRLESFVITKWMCHNWMVQ